MKKLLKAAVMMFVMSCVACLCFGATAFAEEYSGKLENGYNWKVDTASKTLILEGEDGLSSNDSVDFPWRQYDNSIKNIILKGNVEIDSNSAGATAVYLNSIADTITGEFESGFSWKYEKATKTITLNGKGAWVEEPNWFFLDVTTVISGDGITSIRPVLLGRVDRLVCGKSLQLTELANSWVQKEYVVDPANPYYASYEGCIYSKDFTSLLRTPFNRDSYILHPSVKELERFSVSITETNRTVVIPWGATRINEDAFILLGNNTVILPDTITSIDKSNGNVMRNTVQTFIYSNNNEVAKQVLKDTSSRGNPEKIIALVVDSVQEYYPDIKIDQTQPSKKTGWQTENGKKYYYNSNGQKLIGWQQVDRAWYCFANDGAMLTNQWMKWHDIWYFLRPSGMMSTNEWFRWNKCWYYTNSNGSMAASKWVLHKGKYYYLRPSGIMATNEWIKGKDGYWYYVDNDGVMMTNAWTPDGHYVNGSGVRTK